MERNAYFFPQKITLMYTPRAHGGPEHDSRHAGHCAVTGVWRSYANVFRVYARVSATRYVTADANSDRDFTGSRTHRPPPTRSVMTFRNPIRSRLCARHRAFSNEKSNVSAAHQFDFPLFADNRKFFKLAIVLTSNPTSRGLPRCGYGDDARLSPARQASRSLFAFCLLVFSLARLKIVLCDYARSSPSATFTIFIR